MGSDPVVGVPHRFSVKALDAQGDTLAIRDIDWSSSDTTIAWFDLDGLLHPRKPGAITVRVSYGGWRKAERRIEIRTPSSRVLLYEPWTGNLAKHWSPFGDPSPRTVDANNGDRALLNNGDGVFSSGVHSATRFLSRSDRATLPK